MIVHRDQIAGRSHNMERFKYLGTTQRNQNCTYLQRNLEQIKIRECLLSFGAESFVFHFAIQKCKDQDTKNCNFVCCFIWVRNLVAHIEGGT